MKNILFRLKKLLTVAVSALVLTLAVGCDFPFLKKEEPPSTDVETHTLVDFKKSGYEQWLTTDEGNVAEGWTDYCSYESTEEGVLFNCTRAWQSRLIYTLPEPIVEKQTASTKGKEEVIYSLTIRYKALPAGNNFTVEFYDVNGKHAYVNFTSQSEQVKDGILTEDSWTKGTIYWHELRKRDGGVDTDERLTSLKSLHVRLNTVGTVLIDEITYTRNEMNFGTEKAGASEIVLADFGVSQYERFLSRADKNSGTMYAIVDGGLELTVREGAAVWNGALDYELLQSVAVSEIKTLKFKADSSFLAYAELVGANGEIMPILPTDDDVTITQTKDGMYEYSLDIENRLTGENGGFDADGVLKTIRLTSASAGSTVFFDEISYVKK